MLAGHLDPVPIADNVPSHRTDGLLHGCGTVDMKSGDAVFLHLAASIRELAHDLTVIMYDAEEIAAEFNGLGRIEREHREWLDADLAILGEPTDGLIEAGCQGTMRARITATGRRAHSARSWLGDNAIHKLGAALERLSAYRARIVDIDGCEYREGLSAVRIDGGVAGNVIPDVAVLDVNFRFAPDRSQAQAEAHIREVFEGLPLEVTITDSAPGLFPDSVLPRLRSWSRRPAEWCVQSTAGRTYRDSRRSEFRRSISVPAIPTSRTPARNMFEQRRSPRLPRFFGSFCRSHDGGARPARALQVPLGVVVPPTNRRARASCG